MSPGTQRLFVVRMVHPQPHGRSCLAEEGASGSDSAGKARKFHVVNDTFMRPVTKIP